MESSELSRSIKAKLQNSFKFEKVFENDEEIAKKVNNFMLSYFNNIGKESHFDGIILVIPSKDGEKRFLALSFNVRLKLGRVTTFNETNDAMDARI